MKKQLYALLLLLMAATSLRAQINFTLVTQPCDHNGVLQATATGMTGPITYSFQPYGSGAVVTNNTGLLTGYGGGPLNVTATASGTTQYSNYAGAPPFNYSVSTGPASCPTLGVASATVLNGTAPYTIQWLASGGTTVLATGATVNLPAGGYKVIITDAAGCKYGSADKGDSIGIYDQSPFNFSFNTTPAACTNGSATATSIVGGQPPYSYLWSNGANTPAITGLTTGSYYLTLTDAQGCTHNNGVYIQQTPAISVNTTITNATCLQTNGSAIAFASGGTPPYSYTWGNTVQTTQTATNLTGGTGYPVQVVDANGCQGSGYAYVQSTTPITATYSATNSSCTSATGTATVSATGGTAPYTIVWNTFPAQTGTTATGLAPGTYHFTVTDAAGCVRTGNAVVPPMSLINANISTTSASCTAANGGASVLASGTATPFTYAWSTGGTASSVSGVAAGSYSVVITDNNGCHITKTATVAASSPIMVGLSTTPATCIFNNDGVIAATATGGTAPYTYTWSNGATTATASALATGNYYLTVHDAVGCVKSVNSSVSYNAANSSCYCTITGTVYNDANANCVKDAGEQGIQNIMVHAAGIGYAYTNAAGIYSIIAPSGTYTMSESVQAYYPLAGCQNNATPVTVTAGTGCTTTVNFANIINPIHDMNVVTTSYAGPPVPGNNYYQSFDVTNDGTVTETALTAGYKHDGQLGAPFIIPTGTMVSNGTNHYSNSASFSTLAPAAHQYVYMQYLVPTNIPLGTTLQYNDSAAYTAPMSNWLTDYTPWNNVNAYQATVVGSFDPNYKEVTPKGTGSAGNITRADSVLTYTIHFQNTGTFKAQKVVLKDTLSGNVVIGSLKPGASSHAYTTTVSDGGALTFIFNNINLPDSGSDRLGSNGYVTYSVHLKKNLAIGTAVSNKASIYFDYNAPVVTNTTLNTIQNPQGIETVSGDGRMGLSVYPNPATNEVTILVQSATDNNAASLRFVNLLGQVNLQQAVVLQKGKNYFKADVRSLAAGMYFVEISNGSGKSVSRLSVTR